MAWETFGNNINAGNDFLGSTNAQPLRIGTNYGAGSSDAIVITPASPPGSPRGFVGIGLNFVVDTPQTPLHVQADTDQSVPTVHTSGAGAAYSFTADHLRGFPNFITPASGERWSWRATNRDGASTPSARLWSHDDKLIVNSYGQVLLPGFPGDPLNVRYPDLDLGDLPPHPWSVSRVHGELFLGAYRTSIRGFDGPLEDPASPGGMHLGYHQIRTNGNDNELWMAFKRFRPVLGGGLGRHAETAVQWFGPRFNDTSDERLKTNVRQVEGALDKLAQIRGVAFDWAEAESPYALGGVPGEPGLGVVAQEVEEVFPDVVSTYGPDQEYKAVDYSGLTSVVIEAVKELKAQNEELRSRIEALEGA